jgi:predicted Zn-dependent peptidase
LDRYLKVTAADIQKAAQQYLVPGERTVLVVEPSQESDRPGAPR